MIETPTRGEESTVNEKKKGKWMPLGDALSERGTSYPSPGKPMKLPDGHPSHNLPPAQGGGGMDNQAPPSRMEELNK
jgi:hypothetical protein